MPTGQEKAGSSGKEVQPPVYEFGPFLLDSETRRLFKNRRVVPLTAKLFDILLLLVRRSGEVVTKEELMAEVWPGLFVEENNLTVSVSALRKALGEDYKERKYIETLPKRGYRFVARVKELKVEGDLPGTGRLEGWRERTEIRAEVVCSSIAVLPLVNKSGDLDLEYLSDGLAENIINSLSQNPQLSVLALSTVSRYKGKGFDVQRVGQELNVCALLTGWIDRSGDRFLIGVELIEVESRGRVWEAQYDCQFSDIFSVQEEIAAVVSEKLRPGLPGRKNAHLVERHTQNAEAYRLYLKGRFFWNKRSVKGIKKAIEYFKRAIERDGNYSLAYSGLADCYMLLASYGVLRPRDVAPKAKAAAVRAVELNYKLAEAHASLAYVSLHYDLDWLKAEAELRRAIGLNPNYATAHQWYAVYLTRLGRFGEAIESINSALEIEPLSPALNKTMARTLYFARDYDAAIRQCFETLELEPNFGPISGQLAHIYIEKRMYEEAAAELQKLIDFAAGDYEVPAGHGLKSLTGLKEQLLLSQSDPEAIATLGYIYAMAGRRGEAEEVLDCLKELSKRRYVEPHALTIASIGLGYKDQAIHWLERAYAERSVITTALKVFPMLDPLRSDQRFIDLCQKVGFNRQGL